MWRILASMFLVLVFMMMALTLIGLAMLFASLFPHISVAHRQDIVDNGFTCMITGAIGFYVCLFLFCVTQWFKDEGPLEPESQPAE